MFLNYTLADFAAKLNIVYPKGFTDDESTNNMDNDLPCNDDDEDNDQSVILLHCSNDVIFKKHQKVRIICYVNYSIKKDPENYYRERLVLFYPWKNESVDLIAGSNSYEDSYKKKQKQIEVVRKEYEPYNDVLEEAIENAEVNEIEDENISDGEQVNTVSNMDKYAFFDPDRHDSLKNYQWTTFTRNIYKEEQTNL